MFPSKERARLHHGMSADKLHSHTHLGLSVVVVGNDALIEALPARPIQLAHACRAAGFDLALPASWGDELVAEATIRALESRNGHPAVLCTCPLVRQRLLASGPELAPLIVSTVPPPVAAGRYVRALLGARLAHLAYLGDCPSASDRVYDAHYSPQDFLAILRERGIDILQQPEVFEAVLPPDRRRHVSLPGGCPTPEALALRSHERTLVGVDGVDVALELAQHLVTRQPVLVDVAPALGCACSGVTSRTAGRSARVAVMSLEPPRAGSAIVDDSLVPVLEAPVAATDGPAAFSAWVDSELPVDASPNDAAFAGLGVSEQVDEPLEKYLASAPDEGLESQPSTVPDAAPPSVEETTTRAGHGPAAPARIRYAVTPPDALPVGREDLRASRAPWTYSDPAAAPEMSHLPTPPDSLSVGEATHGARPASWAQRDPASALDASHPVANTQTGVSPSNARRRPRPSAMSYVSRSTPSDFPQIALEARPSDHLPRAYMPKRRAHRTTSPDHSLGVEEGANRLLEQEVAVVVAFETVREAAVPAGLAGSKEPEFPPPPTHGGIDVTQRETMSTPRRTFRTARPENGRSSLMRALVWTLLLAAALVAIRLLAF